MLLSEVSLRPPDDIYCVPCDFKEGWVVHWTSGSLEETAKVLRASSLSDMSTGDHRRRKCIKHINSNYMLDVDCDGVWTYDRARNPNTECGRD